MPRPVEGDKCPHFGADCCGLLALHLDGDCCCGAVHAPCPACEGCYLECDDCGWDSRDDAHRQTDGAAEARIQQQATGA